MKATIESTSKVVTLTAVTHHTAGKPNARIEAKIDARIWTGVTEKGVKFNAYITRLEVMPGQDNAQFEEELKEMRPPTAAVASIPMRLIL